MNFNLHFGEFQSDNSINGKNNLFEIYIPKCYKVKRILISFNCFSEYTTLLTDCSAGTKTYIVHMRILDTSFKMTNRRFRFRG